MPDVPCFLRRESEYSGDREEAGILLKGPIGSRMQPMFRIVARPRFARSQEFVKPVDRLYSDGRGNVKRGAASDTNEPGSIHGPIRTFQRLELTCDIFDMSCEKMIGLLPPEFDGWLDSKREALNPARRRFPVRAVKLFFAVAFGEETGAVLS